MSPYQIRPATAADLAHIVAMRDQLNALELAGCPHASIQKLSVEQFTALWGPTLTKPDYCWRVIESAGQLIGYGLIFLSQPRSTPPAAYVQWAYLDPAHRRRGMGVKLLEELLSWAKAQGANRVELQFIDGNVVAESFWLKMGFQPFARKCVRYF
jgi:GNAT superfamily N-acetyltransferase